MGFIHASQRLVFEVEYSLNIFKISSIIFHSSDLCGVRMRLFTEKELFAYVFAFL